MDPAWHNLVSDIYREYDLYHLSGGKEQVLFTGGPALPTVRSQQIIDCLKKTIPLPENGHLLDVGCGTGALLRSFGASYPKWNLTGAELNDRFRREVEGIPNVEHFHAGPINQIDRTFDLITLLHVMEHVFEPGALLKSIREKLAPNGLVLIQVPNLPQNAFDLVVADHCSHFTPQTLVTLARLAGFAVTVLSEEWVFKEISLVLSPDGQPQPGQQSRTESDQSYNRVRNQITWLGDLVDHARQASARGKLGIFGTAIAGTWLAQALGPAVSFFVDEDVGRAGKTYLSRPVLLPNQAPAGSMVYLALPPPLAKRISERLQPACSQATLVQPLAMRVDSCS
jgi:SAM-dependent methyltransferase